MPQTGSARTAQQSKKSSGPIYMPPETLYDAPEYTATDRDEPDTAWPARFQD